MKEKPKKERIKEKGRKGKRAEKEEGKKNRLKRMNLK